MQGERERSSLIFLHLVVQFDQHHLSKILTFLQCVLLGPGKVTWFEEYELIRVC